MNDAQRSPAMIAGAFVFARVITFSTGRNLPRTDTKQRTPGNAVSARLSGRSALSQSQRLASAGTPRRAGVSSPQPAKNPPTVSIRCSNDAAPKRTGW